MTTLPADWPEYAKLANVGPTGTDVAVSGTTYTVKTACGLAWIAWVTNNGKTITDADKTYTDSYPASEASRTVRLRLRTISRWRNLPKAWRAASRLIGYR